MVWVTSFMLRELPRPRAYPRAAGPFYAAYPRGAEAAYNLDAMTLPRLDGGDRAALRQPAPATGDQKD